MTPTQAAAKAAARIVLDAGAVYMRAGREPFFFSSGWASPIFIDIKRLISLPEARQRLVGLGLDVIEAEIGSEKFDQIAGCELAGVPFAAIIADRLELPLVVALKQARGFGRLAQCEGEFGPRARTLLIDDVTTDGRTKATFKAALERAQAQVVAIFVFLNYRIFPGTPQIVSLMTLADIVAVAERHGRFEADALREVRDFAANAPDWSARNGGIGNP